MLYVRYGMLIIKTNLKYSKIKARNVFLFDALRHTYLHNLEMHNAAVFQQNFQLYSALIQCIGCIKLYIT